MTFFIFRIVRVFYMCTALWGSVLISGCSVPSIQSSSTNLASMADFPPIVFVHGNGDTAALWQSTLWRFESNGWPRSRLHAI